MNSMVQTEIHAADELERDQASLLLAGSEPWVTLGITADQCRKTCHDPEYMVYMAYTGHKPSGIIILDPRGVAGSPYMKSIAVYREFRGQGIGSALLAYAESLFRSKYRHMFLCVSSFNQRAQNFYEAHGYQVVGEFKDYIIEGESEILMHKRI
jgi:[ribosomal protein S18]-alanine N-acetyltransferase